MVDILEMPFGNVFAVQCAFARLGVMTRVVRSPDDVASSSALVVPGVGAFGATLAALRDRGVADLLAGRVAARRPTLGICLGMQIFFAGSEESPGVAGLGVLSGQLARVTTAEVPHFGWAEVGWSNQSSSQWAFFSHSFAAEDVSPGFDDFELAMCRSGGSGGFVAALRSGAVSLCQFHPELSGRSGSEFLKNWIDVVRGES